VFRDEVAVINIAAAQMEGKSMEEICKQLFSDAAPFLSVRCNQEHTEITFRFAKELQKILGGRKEIIFPAIILHDVGWSAIAEELHLQAFGPDADPNLNRIHEIEGAKIAAKLLQRIALSEADKQEICRIIESHDSGQNPINLEEKIVKDADKLFRFSPRGFSIDAQRFNVDLRDYWNKLHEFSKHWFLTEPAKTIARRELAKVEQELLQ
jgi:HD superfamily phosphohydrolase YqeK